MKRERQADKRQDFYKDVFDRYQQYYIHLWWVLPLTLAILLGIWFWENDGTPKEERSKFLKTEERAIELEAPSEVMDEVDRDLEQD